MLLAALAQLGAQEHGSITGTPYSSPEDRVAGMTAFRTACAACHGLEGAGGAHGPALNRSTFQHGSSDGDLFRTITQGVKDTPMAAYPLPAPDVWRLITYIRSLHTTVAEQGKGDAAAGARVFASQGCAGCHRAAGTGGFTGPDLSAIGSLRTLAQLENSVLDPDVVVAPEYWSLRGRTKAGEAIAGIRMNEDMESFQIREASGLLHSVWKKDLASYEIVHASPMPSFRGKLKPPEVQDLVAYLASLRGGEGK